MARPKNIVASAEVPAEETARGKRFHALRRRLGLAAGGEKRSGGPLRFLAFSTMTYPEVATYPESRKVGIYGGPAKADRRDLGVFKLSSAVDYWEGEE